MEGGVWGRGTTQSGCCAETKLKKGQKQQDPLPEGPSRDKPRAWEDTRVAWVTVWQWSCLQKLLDSSGTQRQCLWVTPLIALSNIFIAAKVYIAGVPQTPMCLPWSPEYCHLEVVEPFWRIPRSLGRRVPWGDCGTMAPLLSLFYSLTMRWVGLFHPHCRHDALPSHRPKATRPTDHGLNLQNHEPKETFSVHKLLSSGILLQG
jgi:hypothetical protein